MKEKNRSAKCSARHSVAEIAFKSLRRRHRRNYVIFFCYTSFTLYAYAWAGLICLLSLSFPYFSRLRARSLACECLCLGFHLHSHIRAKVFNALSIDAQLVQCLLFKLLWTFARAQFDVYISMCACMQLQLFFWLFSRSAGAYIESIHEICSISEKYVGTVRWQVDYLARLMRWLIMQYQRIAWISSLVCATDTAYDMIERERKCLFRRLHKSEFRHTICKHTYMKQRASAVRGMQTKTKNTLFMHIDLYAHWFVVLIYC